MVRLVTLLINSVFITGLLCLGSCGGGGGGGFAGAGRVSINAEPQDIDIGDRMEVSVDIDDASDDGVILKIAIPDGLDYVLDSSFLETDGNEIDVGPQVNVETNGVRFLVFFFSRSIFDENGDGILTFQLEGVESVNNGNISVDIDVDDPLVDNDNEFDPENAEFQTEDSVDVSVED